MRNIKKYLTRLLFVSVMLMLPVNIFAQQKFSGVVKDESGTGLVGVTVVEKESKTNGTFTDENGQFTINVAPESVLVFSYVGFETQSLTVTNPSLPITVVMQEKGTNMNEVVVIGFGSQKKINLSGAVASVSAKTIKDRPIVNLGQALQGVVPNLNVDVGNGRADASPDYNIRGHNSINGNDGPMIVIDGIVGVASDLNNLNPNDIESISVLKDASSAAIYGSRASFGVILVTTKSGNSEKTTITYNNSFAFKSPTFRPQIVKDPYLNMSYLNKMGAFQFSDDIIEYSKRVNEDPFLPKYIELGGQWTYFGSTNWYDEFFKKESFSMQHNLEVSGKSKRSSYLLSANYFNDTGLLKPADENYDRYNLRSKVNYQVTDWLTMGNNTSYMRNQYDRPSAFGDGFLYYPQTMGTYELPYNPEGGWSSAGAMTIGGLIDGGKAQTINNVIQTKTDVKIDLIKNVLSIKGNFSYTYGNEYYKTAEFPVEYKGGPQTPFTWGTESSAQKVNRPKQQLYVDGFTTFNKTFNQKHAVSAVAGYSQETYRSEYQWYKRTGLITSSLPTPQMGTGVVSMNESVSKWAMRSGFGRLNYIFDSKYIAEFNGRYDGSSRFPKGHRYVFSPSGSLAWVISSENFFEPLKQAISHMKIRVSYGELANQATSNFAYLPTMDIQKTGIMLDGKNPMTIAKPANLISGDYTWETIITKNLGLDINFLSDRLTFSGDIYVRDNNNMLAPSREFPGVLGAGAPDVNSASLRTKGWEVSLAWKDNTILVGKPLSYGFNLILADNQAKVTKYDNPTGKYENFYVGKRIGEIWGLETEGYFASLAEVKNHADQSAVIVSEQQAGDLKFKDQNGDHKIDAGKSTLEDPGDYKIIGNSSKRYTFGLTLTAEWNRFDFNSFFQGVGKREFYPTTSGMNVDYEFFSYFATQWTHLTPQLLNNHWTPEDTDAFYPRLKAGAAGTSGKELAAVQTKYLLNGAYLRWKNLTLGYTLPENIVSKAKIERVRLFLSGENLCTWSKLPGFYKVDPEIAGRSGNGGGIGYSLQRTYSFGVNVTF